MSQFELFTNACDCDIVKPPRNYHFSSQTIQTAHPTPMHFTLHLGTYNWLNPDDMLHLANKEVKRGIPIAYPLSAVFTIE